MPGGRPRKSREQHKKEGTLRSYHGSEVNLEKPLFPKPEHCPPEERTVAPKWIRGPQDEWAVEEGYWFEEAFAEHFRDFCRQYLCLWEGKQWAGKPFELMDWQWLDVFAPLFGWFRWDDEWGCPVRRFDRVYVEVGKKNGKSPMAAAVGCYFLAGDGETGGKVFSAASAREQAGIVHGHAINMVSASPQLHHRCKINRSDNTIIFEPPEIFERFNVQRAPANNVYKSISSEAGPQEGRNANCIIADELHVWQGRKLWDALKYAFEARISPLMFCITTAGEEEQSVCYEQHEYARDVASGHVRDLGFLSYIRAADKDDDPSKEETWRKANPSLGVTITAGRLEQMYQEASRKSAALASFKRYRLNIWGTVADPLFEAAAWDACYEPYTAEDLAGELCFGGLDVSKTEDMTAVALMFPMGGGEYRQLCWFWLPEEAYEKNRDRVEYDEWRRQGWLEICPGARIDESIVEEKIRWADEQFDLESVHYDPYRASGIVRGLEDSGIQCVEFPQTLMRFAEPTVQYEALVAKGLMHHNGNGCLTWQSRHTKTKADMNKNERPVKPLRGDIRTIDGIVAEIMALALAMGHEESVYDEPGKELLVL